MRTDLAVRIGPRQADYARTGVLIQDLYGNRSQLGPKVVRRERRPVIPDLSNWIQQ
jgi:hypothetical protein